LGGAVRQSLFPTGTAEPVVGLAVGGWLFLSREAHTLTDKDMPNTLFGIHLAHC